ncbi:MAG: type I restriction enzyme HsdR N-terminal domain-containing protein [Pseudomonas sp.]|nr:type I restriction enzyme HsdR N-terminal domain-containing protein [Pseudomonas sp.]
MNVQQAITEADLEARVHQAIAAAFPFLVSGDVQHQTSFQLNLGHTPITLKGVERYNVGGRADVIVSVSDSPCVLLELKRPGLKLTEEDAKQGLSYARLLTPMPPIVVVSNGMDTRLYLTYTGQPWVPSEDAHADFLEKLKSVGQLAASDLSKAVEVLMGVEANWVPGIQATSAMLVEARSGEWDEPLKPFVRDFLIPRKATCAVVDALERGKFVALSGAPLAGKSSILREMVAGFHGSTSEAVLLLESNDGGLFQAIANVLADKLDWNVSVEQARDWLRNLSKRSVARMIVAIDGFQPDHSQVLADIEELASGRFGAALGVILAVDDTGVDSLMKKPSGREESAFGRRTEVIEVGALDDEEFIQTDHALRAHRVTITHGGRYVRELREPWVIRALVPAEALRDLDAPENSAVRLPPILDLHSLSNANGVFAQDATLLAVLDHVAGAILEYYRASRTAGETIQGLGRYLIPQVVLAKHLDGVGQQTLKDRGLLKAGLDWSGQAIWFVRLPALMAARIGVRLSREMTDWGDDAHQRLRGMANRLPLGELVAAEALRLKIERGEHNVFPCIQGLLDDAPTLEPAKEGLVFITEIEGHRVQGRLLPGRRIEINANGRKLVTEVDPEEGEFAMTLCTSWLILSHLCVLPLGVQVEGEEGVMPLGTIIIEELAASTCVLMSPDGLDIMEGVPTHGLPDQGSYVCHKAGIVEPITWALHHLLLLDGPLLTDWVKGVAGGDSIPLLSRTSIALHQLCGLLDARGQWAKEMLEQHIGPAIDETHKIQFSRTKTARVIATRWPAVLGE